MRGEFIDAPTDSAGVDQWCDTEVLRILRRRSLAALRAQIEPVSTAALGRFLPAWQLLGSETVSGRRRAGRGDRPARRCAAARLGGRAADLRPAGARLSARRCSTNCWPPARCSGRAPAHCRRPTAGSPSTPPTPRRCRWPPPAELELTDVHRAVLDALGGGGAYFFRQLAVDGVSTESLKEALWQLIWSGMSVATPSPRCGPCWPARGAGRAAAGRTVAPASSRTAAEPLQHQLRAGASRRRPDGGRAVVGTARRRDRHDGACALPGRAAAGPPRRAHQGCGGQREGRPRRIRLAVQGAHRAGGRGAVSARLLRRIPWRRPVRDRQHRRPAAQPTRTASTKNGTSTRPSRWPRPIPPTRSALPCRGPMAPTGRAARPERWWCSSTVSWPGSSNAAAGRC